MTKSKQHTVELRRLPADQVVDFHIQPDAEERAAIIVELEVSALRKLRFEGTLTPAGKADWALEAHLGATVVQPCVVTLNPVSTRIDIKVSRRYLADMPDAGEEDDFEMPEDDTVEPIPSVLDLWRVMIEALTLEIPDYPRAEDASLEQSQFAAPGVTPMTDDDAKPMAALAELKKRMEED